MDLGKLVEWIKLSPKHLLPVSLFTGFTLFAPPEWLTAFGIVGLVSDYRPYLGAAFLLSAALLSSALIVTVQGQVASRRRQARRDKYMRQRLHNLAEPEKEILRGFLRNETRTQYLSMADGRVGGLEAEKIIFRSSNVGFSLDHWAYNIQPWAWEYLKKRPKLLS
jgi:hypothetical protein